MTNLFGERDPRDVNRYVFRIDKDVTEQARKKASEDGTTLATLLKCFIVGYLSGDLLAESILKYGKR